MASSYTAFSVVVGNDSGTTTPVPNATVRVYHVDAAADLGVLTADAAGVVINGTLNIPPGSLVRFRVENDGFGRASFVEQTTA